MVLFGLGGKFHSINFFIYDILLGKLPIPGSGRQQQQQQDVVGAHSAYSFDSTALERAAKAARTLEQSANAKQALELSRMQELTKQKEADLQRLV